MVGAIGDFLDASASAVLPDSLPTRDISLGNLRPVVPEQPLAWVHQWKLTDSGKTTLILCL